jgi:hypothetical protein
MQVANTPISQEDESAAKVETDASRGTDGTRWAMVFDESQQRITRERIDHNGRLLLIFTLGLLALLAVGALCRNIPGFVR